MSKSGKFIKIKTAVFIGGLCCVLPITQANALNTMCDDCYRCTLGTESNCRGTCVYDEDYCMLVDQCPDGYLWNGSKCVEDSGSQICMDGSYNDGTACVDCPAQGDCTILTGKGTGINSCYIAANSCNLTDTTGTYTYSSNCYYQ